jgi:hypothetical protein
MGWKSDLDILLGFYENYGHIARNLQADVSGGWLRTIHSEDGRAPSKRVEKAIEEHANGTDGTRSQDEGEEEQGEEDDDNEETLGPGQDRRLAGDLDVTPRDTK